jgi:hypothetical protein
MVVLVASKYVSHFSLCRIIPKNKRVMKRLKEKEKKERKIEKMATEKKNEGKYKGKETVVWRETESKRRR